MENFWQIRWLWLLQNGVTKQPSTLCIQQRTLHSHHRLARWHFCLFSSDICLCLSDHASDVTLKKISIWWKSWFSFNCFPLGRLLPIFLGCFLAKFRQKKALVLGPIQDHEVTLRALLEDGIGPRGWNEDQREGEDRMTLRKTLLNPHFHPVRLSICVCAHA
jgi:hypothetical protein